MVLFFFSTTRGFSQQERTNFRAELIGLVRDPLTNNVSQFIESSQPTVWLRFLLRWKFKRIMPLFSN